MKKVSSVYSGQKKIISCPAAFFIPILLLPILLLTGCYSTEKGNEVDFNKLSRVDVLIADSDGTYSGEEIIIFEEKDLQSIGKIFKSMKWKKNVIVDMSRKEDVKVTLFIQIDQNRPERLIEYLIWFENNGTATIIRTDVHGYGKLNQTNTQSLKEIIFKQK